MTHSSSVGLRRSCAKPFVLRSPAVIVGVAQSENVLQRELQDSRIKSRTDLSESVAVQGGRIADRDASTYGRSPGDAGRRTACCALYAAGPEAIRHIKCFDSNFKPLCLANVERSGQRHI